MKFRKRRHNWIIKTADAEKVNIIKNELSVSDFSARLLVLKGFDTPKIASSFINKTSGGFHDPYLLCDMDKAVARITKALEEKEKITIYGDYDVDGITSVSVLYRYLKKKGVDVSYYIPDRLSEGYGMSEKSIHALYDKGTRLIVTVDTGVTAYKETEYAKELGIDVVITDHHECREELPQAVAVINPHRKDSVYPFESLAGVGVVFKLICGLEKNTDFKYIASAYSELVALGTISDVMPLCDENRLIVSLGLHYMRNTKIAGISALISLLCADSKAVRKINTGLIGFGIAPRINAAGRIGDVNKAAELLITDDAQRAQEIAAELFELNTARQEIELKIFEEVKKTVESTHDFEKDRVIVVSGENWHMGVIGIVASRITESYSLPCVLVSFDGDSGKGSARSIRGFNINEAFNACSDYLEKYGGHELAAGLSIDRKNFEEFKLHINYYASKIITDSMISPDTEADAELLPSEININNAEELSEFEPFGTGNRQPLFYTGDLVIDSISPLKDGKYIKIQLSSSKDRDLKFTGLYFNKRINDFEFCIGDSVDILYNLDINEFRGVRSVQLLLKDIRYGEEIRNIQSLQNKKYKNILVGLNSSHNLLPTKAEFSDVFLYIQSVLNKREENGAIFDTYYAAKQISLKGNTETDQCKLNFILDIFSDSNIIELERTGGLNEVYIKIVPRTEKADLTRGSMYRFLEKLEQKTV